MNGVYLFLVIKNNNDNKNNVAVFCYRLFFNYFFVLFLLLLFFITYSLSFQRVFAFLSIIEFRKKKVVKSHLILKLFGLHITLNIVRNQK